MEAMSRDTMPVLTLGHVLRNFLKDKSLILACNLPLFHRNRMRNRGKRKGIRNKCQLNEEG
jgi:hypothetical protein